MRTAVGEFDDEDGGDDWEWENEQASSSTNPPPATSTASLAQPLSPPQTIITVSTPHVHSAAIDVDEEEVEEEELAVEQEEEYEMDHEQATTPALLSPAPSLSASTFVPLTLRATSPDSTLQESQEEMEPVAEQDDDTEADYETDVQHHEAADQHSSDAVTSQAEQVAVNSDSEQAHSVSAAQELPTAATLNPAVTGDFSVHQPERSFDLSSIDRADQSVYEQRALSPQPSFDVQSVPATPPPASPTLLSPLASDPSQALPFAAAFDTTEARSSDASAVSSQRMLASESVDLVADDSGFESLSLSAIAPSLSETEVAEDRNFTSALSIIDADFTSTSISIPPSATATASASKQSPAVVVEDEVEEDDLLQADSKHDSQPSPRSLRAITPQASAAEPPSVLRPSLTSPAAAAPKAADFKVNDAATIIEHSQTSVLAADSQPAPPATTVPLTHQQHRPQHTSVRRHPVAAHPSRVALRRAPLWSAPTTLQPSTFPFPSPPHALSPQSVFHPAPPGRPRHSPLFVARPVQHMPVALSVAPPALPAPTAPSAAYVASKQALLQTIARHQHIRASKQQQAQQQQRAVPSRSTFATAESYHDILGGSDERQWQLQRHGDERLARMLKVWQLNGQGNEGSMRHTRREQEEKEDVELEWLARQEEQRRQEARRWRRGSAHRPPTPAAPLYASSAWQDEDEASEANELTDSTPSMVQLMESLRVSARHEIAVQDAVRQRLR